MWKTLDLSFASRLSCKNCGCVSVKPEHLSALPLDLPDEPCSVEVLLANQWGEQPLKAGDDPYRCPREPPCSTAAIVTRTVTPTTWPKTLILSLKRFRAQLNLGRFSQKKVPTHVSFETVLLPHTDAPPYHLKGVIEHHGEHATGGHYTSRVRASDNYWYHCDDVLCPRRTSTEETLKAQAYVLIYERT